MEIYVYALFALFALLQIGDAASTFAVLARGGSEANRFIVSLGDSLGSIRFALVMVKIAAVWAAGVLVYFTMPWPAAPIAVLAVLCAVYVWVVAHNVVVWRGLKP